MTKKDFELIASIIAEMPPHVRECAAARFTQELKVRFPGFKSSVFLKACNLARVA